MENKGDIPSVILLLVSSHLLHWNLYCSDGTHLVRFVLQ